MLVWDRAQTKADRTKMPAGLPEHSCEMLLADLGALPFTHVALPAAAVLPFATCLERIRANLWSVDGQTDSGYLPEKGTILRTPAVEFRPTHSVMYVTEIGSRSSWIARTDQLSAYIDIP